MQLSEQDEALIARAEALIAKYGDGYRHTVASAARDADGRIVEGLNVYHYTGGPCAEIVVLGMAASSGLGPLESIVAVGDAGRGVVAPCGRCRQMLYDLHRGVRVITAGPDGPRVALVTELLPGAYVAHTEP